MFNKAKSFQTENTFTVSSYDEFKDILSNKGGFIKCGWDGTSETEAAIKNETKATIRVIPMDENPKGLNCIYSGKPAKHEVIFAKEKGADIHAAPIKTHKLEIVAGREHKFGQYIIDKESKQLEFDFDKEVK